MDYFRCDYISEGQCLRKTGNTEILPLRTGPLGDTTDRKSVVTGIIPIS